MCLATIGTIFVKAIACGHKTWATMLPAAIKQNPTHAPAVSIVYLTDFFL